MRLGLTVPLAAHDLRASCDIARRAEGLGYTDVWTEESSGADCFAAAASVAIATEEVRIGCAIAPVFTRPPALLAMSTATVQQASGGRFCVGLGTSTPTIVDGWMGLAYDRPVMRVAETIEVLRAALSGEKVQFEGETVRVSGFRLGLTVPAPVPVYVAALGPRMMALAAAKADGIALFLTTPRGVEIAAESAPGKDIMARLICCPDEPVDDVRSFARWALSPYIAADGYNRFLIRQGFGDAALAVQKLWRDGDRDGARSAIPDALIDALVLMGPAERCRERLDEFRAAGLTTPVLWFLSLGGSEGVTKAVESMAPTS